MYYRVNKNMTEGEICDKILKGLPEEIYEKIGLLDNNTINGINANIERWVV